MADELETPLDPDEETTSKAPSTPTPKKSSARRTKAEPAPESKGEEAEPPVRKKKAKEAGPKVPRRPKLTEEAVRLLRTRKEITGRRPKFVRTASHRYWRIGRWESWRAPTGIQSKQRRHYGYRPTVVSIGFGSPAATRGLTPSGFRPILVRTEDDLVSLNPQVDAALIARTVGTRRRLVLEETARKKGVHVLNPIVRESEE
jgi:large subunit ribosomal protein L32e